jgi:poly(A) polymerase
VNPPAELLEALLAPAAAERLRALDAAGVLTELLPELEAGRGFAQPGLHFYDVLQHNLAAVECLDSVLAAGHANDELRAAFAWVDVDESFSRAIEGLPILSLIRLACLVHDVAKPATAVHLDGRLRFPRHGPRGAELMRERLPLLGFGPQSTDLVARLVRYHLRPGELIRAWPVSDRAVRRFINDLDGHVLPLMLVNLSDGMATQGPRYTREHYRRHCTFLNYVVARAWSVDEAGEPRLITGDDLITELDLQSGRLLGAVLTSVRQAQLEGAVSRREDALSLARSVLATLTTDP